MDRMRLMLLFIGVVVLLMIYFFGRWQQRRQHRMTTLSTDAVPEESILIDGHVTPDAAQLERELEGLERLIAEDSAAVAEPGRSAAAVSALTAGVKDKFVVLYIVAPAGGQFAGAEVKRLFKNEELNFGKMDIYHHTTKVPSDAGVKIRPVFSVANLAEPGSFDPNAMETGSVKGLTMFLRLPGPIEGVAAFECMLASAQRLAADLNGELRDSTHSVLSHQTIQHIRGDIKGCEYRHKFQQRV
ncbi:MAG: cell division protein ZipA C-terminal FtsZ-binding domain-containing protein [Gammaproteobacteria bacterium]